MTFGSLGLTADLESAAHALGLSQPTEVQAQAIPAVLRGADVFALAPTGSGKTAAFVLPLLQRLRAEPAQAPRRVRALVLVPTRELAAQVGEVFRNLGRDAPEPLRVAILFGGVSVNPQMMGLRGGADVVVATPGRLKDHLTKRRFTLALCRYIVLDEGDRMLDMGFDEDIKLIFSYFTRQRQTIIFSATMPKKIQDFAREALVLRRSLSVAPGLPLRFIMVGTEGPWMSASSSPTCRPSWSARPAASGTRKML